MRISFLSNYLKLLQLSVLRPSLLIACLAYGTVALGQVVALGASNTEGKGVWSKSAYPAQLEQMLLAQGITVRVVNEGISGDTIGGMLSRLDKAAPEGTKVVIFQPGGNDVRAGSDIETIRAKAAQLVSRLESRGIKVIVVRNSDLAAIPKEMVQYDGIHLTAEGHKLLATRLLPQVQDALAVH